MPKQKVAVLFGGKSAEHDISTLTGIQIVEAMDGSKYEAIPVYVDTDGSWWTGKELLNRKNYYLSDATKKKLSQVVLAVGEKGSDEQPRLRVINNRITSNLFGAKYINFDIAFFAFHGSLGEDGSAQGVFEMENIPYTSSRVLASAVFMDKAVAKSLFRSEDIPVLSDAVIERPANLMQLDVDALIKSHKISFPAIAKPCNLGSSIGIYKVINEEELHSALLAIFKLDNQVILEPFVENLVEYNISVSKAGSENGQDICVSAIERPLLGEGGVLEFADKYLANGDLDSKLSAPTEGMVSATREINPSELTAKQKELIISSAKKAFAVVGGCGAPRIDFLCNSKTGELWLNEVNGLPGSIGYYLWEAAEPKIGFTKLISALIAEGFSEHSRSQHEINPQIAKAGIFTQ